MKDPEELLRETLSDAAAQAPEQINLDAGPTPIHGRPRRVMPLLAAGLAAVTVVVGVVAIQRMADSAEPTQPAATQPVATPEVTSPDKGTDDPPDDGPPALPDGWRWESFGGIQVGVPGSWGWDNSSQRVGQYCIEDNNAADPNPAVGRPGPSTLVGCIGTQGDDEPEPSTLIKNAGIFVGFENWLDGPKGVVEEGDRTTVTIGTTSVMVQAERSLRDKIVATVHEVDVDAYGCAATDPISKHPQSRPSPAISVADLTDVTSVSVCKYALSYSEYTQSDFPPMLLSSAKLQGADARSAIAGIASSPAGTGPDSPETCLGEVSYGDDLIVLRVQSSAGTSEIVMRYSGCNHNGFDDGTATYQLTPDGVAPFVTGANRVTSFSGYGKEQLFF